MKYENAKDVLPPELLEQVQKYAMGKLLYIPQKEEPKAWGSISGSRQKLLKRNQRIYNEYIDGKGVSALSEEYFLSIDSIKKIVYGKNREWIPFNPTIDSAIQYSEAGLAEEWIRTYYSKKYGEKTYPEEWICDGLVKIPLRLVNASCDICVDNAWQNCEPLILLFREGKFIHQGKGMILEHLRSQHINAYPAFIFVTDKKEYTFYVNNYGKYFHQARF